MTARRWKILGLFALIGVLALLPVIGPIVRFVLVLTVQAIAAALGVVASAVIGLMMGLIILTLVIAAAGLAILWMVRRSKREAVAAAPEPDWAPPYARRMRDIEAHWARAERRGTFSEHGPPER